MEIWSASNNQEIVFEQSCLNYDKKNIDSENINLETIYLDQRKVFHYEKFNQHQFIWNDENYLYNLTVSNLLNNNDYMSIISSLKEYVE